MEEQRNTNEPGDVIKLRGCVEVALRNAFNGEIIQYVKGENAVVTTGRRWVLLRIQSSSPPTTTLTAIAVGTGTTAAATSDTALGNEVTGTTGRVAISSFDTTNVSSSTPNWQAQASFSAAQAIGTLGEIGLFNTTDATAGTMFSRYVLGTTINKTTSNTLSVSYTISN